MKNKLLTASCLAAAFVLGSGDAKAITLDLTDATTSGFVNGAFFTTSDVGSTGTGVISSFVRVQDNGVADGYNATARPVMPDVNTSPTFTHDLLLSAVPVVSLLNVSYYEFLLDINQTNANPLLSLDKIDIYTRPTALTTADTLADLTAGPSVLRYSLDAGADSEILLDYSRNAGSGSGDLFAYIPTSLFGANTDYLYLYSMFGAKGVVGTGQNAVSYAENDGFEEWAVRTPTTPPTSVPDGGSSLALFGLALTGIGMLGKFRKKALNL